MVLNAKRHIYFGDWVVPSFFLSGCGSGNVPLFFHLHRICKSLASDDVKSHCYCKSFFCHLPVFINSLHINWHNASGDGTIISSLVWLSYNLYLRLFFNRGLAYWTTTDWESTQERELKNTSDTMSTLECNLNLHHFPLRKISYINSQVIVQIKYTTE